MNYCGSSDSWSDLLRFQARSHAFTREIDKLKLFFGSFAVIAGITFSFLIHVNSKKEIACIVIFYLAHICMCSKAETKYGYPPTLVYISGVASCTFSSLLQSTRTVPVISRSKLRKLSVPLLTLDHILSAHKLLRTLPSLIPTQQIHNERDCVLKF